MLSRFQPDVRDFEKVTLYRSTVIHDKAQSLGYPFLIYYNGKIAGGYEKIGMAVSKDMVHWKRYGADAFVANGEEKQRWHLRQSADRAHGRRLGDVLLRRVLEAERVRHLRRFLRPGETGLSGKGRT